MPPQARQKVFFCSAPYPQDGGRLQGQVNGGRHEPPGPAEREWPGRGKGGAPPSRRKGPLISRLCMRKASARPASLARAASLLNTRGSSLTIAAGHYQGFGALGEEQQVYWGIGKHEAQIGVARGHVPRDFAVRALPGQDYGPLRG